MLLDSATATTRLFLALLVCGLSEACASTAAAPSTRDQKSDLVFTSRQRQANRGWIGILVGTAETGSGVRVLSVVPDSPAAAAGIVAGDDLMRVCGHSFAGPEDFIREVRASNPGTVLTIAGLRAGAERAFQVSVEAMPDENAVLERIFVGRPAPSLDGLVAIGSSAEPRWEQLRGRVVVLDFWAPWCGVCHLVASDLNQWQAEYSERLQVIGISAASVHDVTRFAPRFHMRYAIAADPDETVSKAFDASAVPLVVIVDATGIVRAVTLGYSSVRMKHMKQLVGQLVSQQ